MTKERKEFRALEIKANYTCNAKCDYCCISNRKEKRSMTHEEIAENVRYFIDTYGIKEVCLSGGEPTVHKSFLENLQFVHSQGLTIYLHTNAIKFSNSEGLQVFVYIRERTGKHLVFFGIHINQIEDGPCISYPGIAYFHSAKSILDFARFSNINRN